MAIPVKVRTGRTAPPVETVTRDISEGGVYLQLAQPLEIGAEIECHLTLPPEICQGQVVRLRCQGKVIRVERPDAMGRIGVAATIESYAFLKPGADSESAA